MFETTSTRSILLVVKKGHLNLMDGEMATDGIFINPSTPEVHKLEEPGSFGLTVKGGLVRLGLCSATADVDQLGTESQSFGYGGTGKCLCPKM